MVDPNLYDIFNPDEWRAEHESDIEVRLPDRVVVTMVLVFSAIMMVLL